jgi:peptide deformylase
MNIIRQKQYLNISKYYAEYYRSLGRSCSGLKKMQNKRAALGPPYPYVLTIGHPILNQVAEPVNVKDPDEMKEIEAFRDATEKWKAESLGISAPQLGLSKRVIGVYQNTYFDDNGSINTTDKSEWRILINPKIISTRKEKGLSHESCVSVGSKYIGLVPRYNTIEIEAFDLEIGQIITHQFNAPDSYLLQHEIDHLDGILFTDRVKIHSEKGQNYPMLFNPYYLTNEAYQVGPDAISSPTDSNFIIQHSKYRHLIFGNLFRNIQLWMGVMSLFGLSFWSGKFFSKILSNYSSN